MHTATEMITLSAEDGRFVNPLSSFYISWVARLEDVSRPDDQAMLER